MSEMRVPTVALPVELYLADGGHLVGRIFLPETAHLHDGPTRPDEWLNDPTPFFPFLPQGGDDYVLANKRELLAVSVPAEANEEPLPEGVQLPARRVIVECRERRFEGTLILDMPASHPRVLDHMNHPETFLTLRAGDRHYVVLKRRITRVVDVGEA
jgi:hypothetical protein